MHCRVYGETVYILHGMVRYWNSVKDYQMFQSTKKKMFWLSCINIFMVVLIAAIRLLVGHVHLVSACSTMFVFITTFYYVKLLERYDTVKYCFLKSHGGKYYRNKVVLPELAFSLCYILTGAAIVYQLIFEMLSRL